MSKKCRINFSEEYNPHNKSKNSIDFMHIFFSNTNYYHNMSFCAIKLNAIKMKRTKLLKSIKYQMKVCQMEIFQIYVNVCHPSTTNCCHFTPQNFATQQKLTPNPKIFPMCYLCVVLHYHIFLKLIWPGPKSLCMNVTEINLTEDNTEIKETT